MGLPRTFQPREVRIFITVSVVFVVAVLFALVWWKGGFLSSGHRVVCGEDLIGRYNMAVKSETQSAYDTNVATMVSEVVSLPSYEKDPNCLYIASAYYAYDGDATKARTTFDVLKRFSEKGVKLNGSLVMTLTMEQLEQRINTLEAGEQPSAAEGRG